MMARFVTGFLALLLVLPVFSQKVGAKVDLSLNTFHITPPDGGSAQGEKGSTLAGFSGGLFAIIPASKGFSCRVELLYSRKGMRKSPLQSGGGWVDVTVPSRALDYIQIPILLQYEHRLSDKAGLTVVSGVYRAFLFHARGYSSAVAGSWDIEDEFKDTDVGLVFGVGSVLRLNQTFDLLLEARCNLGLTNVYKSDWDESRLRNRGFSLSAGIML